MLVSETVHQAESGQRKQLTMEGWAASALSRNPEMSKGLTAYECLMMADESCQDQLSRAESRALDELAEETGEDVGAALDELVESRLVEARERLADACDYDDPWEDVYPTNIYVISDIDEQLPARGAGRVIENAVAWTAASPWSSRMERINDLQDLLMVARNEGAPSDATEFVRAVEDGESERWDVGRLHSIISPNIEFWERDDLTTTDLTEDGVSEIKQNPTKRVTALETAASNMEDFLYDRETLQGLADRAFDDVSKDASDRYAERVDLDTVNEGIDSVTIDTDSLIDSVVESIIESTSKAETIKETERMIDYRAAGWEEDPRNHDGEYSPEEAGDVLEDLYKIIDHDASANFGIIEKGRDMTIEWHESKAVEVQELRNQSEAN